MPIAFNPFRALYTRQQVHEATGLSLDLLGYWIKEGLLRAKEAEGLGRGKHRRFGFEALHIVAILAEVHHYGVGLTGLRPIADILWDVAALPERFPGVTENAVLDCKVLHSARRRYPPRVSCVSATDNDEDVECFEDWLDTQQAIAPIDPMAFELEHIFTPSLHIAFALYFDLFSDRTFVDLDIRLFVVRLPSGRVAILPTDVPESGKIPLLSAYLSLNVSSIIHSIWDGIHD